MKQVRKYQIYQDEHLAKLLTEEDSEDAFEELYYRYWKRLLVHARFKIGSEEDAEEIVQTVFMNIWKIRKQLHLKNTFHTYIASCVKYEILATLARQKKKQERTTETVLHSTSLVDNTTSDWVDYESTRQQLEDAIQNLPEKCRLVFQLSRERGFSEKQIADKLGISSKTVQGHITRAIKMLRTSLQTWGLF